MTRLRGDSARFQRIPRVPPERRQIVHAPPEDVEVNPPAPARERDAAISRYLPHRPVLPRSGHARGLGEAAGVVGDPQRTGGEAGNHGPCGVPAELLELKQERGPRVEDGSAVRLSHHVTPSLGRREEVRGAPPLAQLEVARGREGGPRVRSHGVEEVPGLLLRVLRPVGLDHPVPTEGETGVEAGPCGGVRLRVDVVEPVGEADPREGDASGDDGGGVDDALRAAEVDPGDPVVGEDGEAVAGRGGGGADAHDGGPTGNSSSALPCAPTPVHRPLAMSQPSRW